MSDTPLYLDCNATTAVLPEALAAMMEALQQAWANPSSIHGPGQAARRALVHARARIAAAVDCQASELVFTSGATEANHMAVRGALAAARGTPRRRWVLSAVEHPGLLALARQLQAEGTPVDRIPVDCQGRLDLDAAQALIGDDVALVSLMGANNETGVLMPVAELAAWTRARGALLHVDATQLAGKAALSFAGSGADLMALSAHKIGGPKGVGALLQRKGLVLPPLLCGRQERQRRGGTENLPGIVGFAAACDHMAAHLHDDITRMRSLRQRLEQGLRQQLPSARLLGDQAERLCNTSCWLFGELDADPVLQRLERVGILASSGAACGAGGPEPSPVLLAMGLEPRRARGGVRFSLGRQHHDADIDRALAAIPRALAPLLARTGSALR